MANKIYSSPRARIQSFTDRLGVQIPILLAPMAGACPPSLSIAVANAGGMGACGALLMTPEAIKAWCAEFRQQSKGKFKSIFGFQICLLSAITSWNGTSESIWRRGALQLRRKRATRSCRTLRHSVRR